MERLYGCDEIAERYKVKKITVWEWIRTGFLPAKKIGKSYKISESDIKTFEKRNQLNNGKGAEQ